jgi:hypothetical protein
MLHAPDAVPLPSPARKRASSCPRRPWWRPTTRSEFSVPVRSFESLHPPLGVSPASAGLHLRYPPLRASSASPRCRSRGAQGDSEAFLVKLPSTIRTQTDNYDSRIKLQDIAVIRLIRRAPQSRELNRPAIRRTAPTSKPCSAIFARRRPGLRRANRALPCGRFDLHNCRWWCAPRHVAIAKAPHRRSEGPPAIAAAR